MSSSNRVLPERHPDLEIAEFDDEYVVFDPRCMDVHQIAGVTAVVFDACDGTSQCASLVEDLVQLLDLDPSAAEVLVTESLEALELRGLLIGTMSRLRPP